jgi:hypothetical protein
MDENPTSCMDHILSLHPSVEGHLWRFHLSVILSSVALNIHLEASLISRGYILRGGTTRLHGNSMFNLLRSYKLPMGCTV